MIRLGEALKRNRDHELYQRPLAHCNNANMDGGGPKPSHFFIVLSSEETTASSITHPRTERWLKSTRTRSPSPIGSAESSSA